MIAPSPTPENPPAPRKHFGRFLLIVLLLPLLAFLSIFVIARSSIFMRTSRRQFWHAMEYQFAPRPGPCDVVIFGDSTGLMGVDPRILTARTGLTACNLGIPYLGLATTGNLTLDHYLGQHPAPRYIIIEVHPSHLRPPTLDDESGIIDGFLLADRKLPPSEAANFFLHHPKHSFYFGAQLWKELISFTPSTTPDLSENTYKQDTAALAAQKGFFTAHYPGGITDCFYQFKSPTFSRSYLQSFNQYAVHGTQVLFWPSPVRHCDRHLADYRAGTAFLGIPPALLLDDNAFTDAQHLSAAGVQQNTDALSDYLQKIAQKPQP